MVTIGPLTFSQYTSLMFTYQGNGVFASIGTKTQQIPLLQEEMVERISKGYLPIVIEGNEEIAWIYLNTLDDPRGYEDLDVTTDYIELEMYLFPVKINKKLRRKLHSGYKTFFETIGVDYSIENGEIVSHIDYSKFEQFIY